MNLRVHAAAIVAALALCGPTLGQAKPETSVRKLRNIAAADAAVALNAFIEKEKLPVAVVAEPVTNSVILAGGAVPIRQVADLLASLDKEPPQVLASFVVMEAPAGFAENVGLGESGEKSWVLTTRETRMLWTIVGLGKGQYDLAVLSKPQLSLINNQTGAMEINGSDADKLNATITPQFMNDGTVKVSAEFQRTTKGKAGEKIQATKNVADGGTVVIRGPRAKADDGKTRETLVILTVHVLKTASDDPKREVLAFPRVPKSGVSARE